MNNGKLCHKTESDFHFSFFFHFVNNLIWRSYVYKDVFFFIFSFVFPNLEQIPTIPLWLFESVFFKV